MTQRLRPSEPSPAALDENMGMCRAVSLLEAEPTLGLVQLPGTQIFPQRLARHDSLLSVTSPCNRGAVIILHTQEIIHLGTSGLATKATQTPLCYGRFEFAFESGGWGGNLFEDVAVLHVINGIM